MRKIHLFVIAALFFSACEIPLVENNDDEGGTTTASYVFVASGTSYPGLGITASTPSQTVVRYRSDGAFDGMVFDYNTLPGDSPTGLADYDADHILVLVYNASGSRVDIVRKDGTSEHPGTFIPSGAGLTAIPRSITPTSDGGWIIARTAAIEKFNSSKNRLLQGANPYVSAPAGVCATTNTAVVGSVVGPSGNIVYTHAAASANHKTVMISAVGYIAAGNCLSSISGSTANHLPTGALLYYTYGGVSRLLVGYSNNTGLVHDIYTHAINATTITAGTLAYGGNLGVLQGASAMAMMTDGTVLIAMASPTLNSVQRFNYDTTTNLLSLAAGPTFIPTGAYTKSISALLVADGNF